LICDAYGLALERAGVGIGIRGIAEMAGVLGS